MSDCRIRTYTGIYFDVLEPDSNLIDIKDIAHAISNQCRFTGHTKQFYSVGEHSVRASYIVPYPMALCALMHDATEAYLVDLPRPIKKHSELGRYFKPIEDGLWQAIALRFNLPQIIPQEVHDADNIMLLTEKRDLMDGNTGMSEYARKWVEGNSLEPLKGILKPCYPREAENWFLQRFGILSGTIPPPPGQEDPRCC